MYVIGVLLLWLHQRLSHLASYIYRYIPEDDNLSPFDSNIARLCQSIEINNNKRISPEPVAKANWQWGWAECSLIIATGCRSFFAGSSIAQSVCQRAFSLLSIWCLRPWVWILHSAEQDNLSPFDSNIACLCQIIEINNNKHIYTWLAMTWLNVIWCCIHHCMI